jgi:hypothetical protein
MINEFNYRRGLLIDLGVLLGLIIASDRDISKGVVP